MLFDVHRLEVFRVKIANVEAASPREALNLTERVCLQDLLASTMARKISPLAKVEDVVPYGAAPVGAMVEVAGSHGANGEHHFDFAEEAGEDGGWVKHGHAQDAEREPDRLDVLAVLTELAAAPDGDEHSRRHLSTLINAARKVLGVATREDAQALLDKTRTNLDYQMREEADIPFTAERPRGA